MFMPPDVPENSKASTTALKGAGKKGAAVEAAPKVNRIDALKAQILVESTKQRFLATMTRMNDRVVSQRYFHKWSLMLWLRHQAKAAAAAALQLHSPSPGRQLDSNLGFNFTDLSQGAPSPVGHIVAATMSDRADTHSARSSFTAGLETLISPTGNSHKIDSHVKAANGAVSDGSSSPLSPTAPRSTPPVSSSPQTARVQQQQQRASVSNRTPLGSAQPKLAAAPTATAQGAASSQMLGAPIGVNLRVQQPGAGGGLSPKSGGGLSPKPGGGLPAGGVKDMLKQMMKESQGKSAPPMDGFVLTGGH
jgi:hypothetical protein